MSAVIAGLIGVVLMLLYMVFYYRKLSVVIILSLVVWALYRVHHGVVRVEHVELRVHDRRCHRDHHQRRRHGRHLCGVLRANPRRDAARSIDGQRRTAQLQVDLDDDPRCQLHLAAGGDRPVLAERRLGQGLRPLPRAHDGVRPAGVLVRRPPGDVPAGPDALVRPTRIGPSRRRRRSERRHERHTTRTAEAPDTSTARTAPKVKRTGWGRLVESQTAIDFVGRRWIGIDHLGGS